ncbi:hypothetical protein AO375_1773 [Moraxella catarrhalis]|nr:hypothetical protein AO375_1773 [Moraxella catarrhalis]OAV38234.1 hypothetical protein AO365_0078 [Moraxella catarrhalis]
MSFLFKIDRIPSFFLLKFAWILFEWIEIGCFKKLSVLD